VIGAPAVVVVQIFGFGVDLGFGQIQTGVFFFDVRRQVSVAVVPDAIGYPQRGELRVVHAGGSDGEPVDVFKVELLLPLLRKAAQRAAGPAAGPLAGRF